MPENFDWPDYTGPSSRIIKKPETWYDKGILVPHEAIRWWNKNIVEIMQKFDPISEPDTEWKTDAFFDWFDQRYVVCVHHHHDAEENIYNPGIEEGIGRPVEENIKTDHAKLLNELEELSSYRDVINEGDSAQLAAFKKKMVAYVKFMDDHLANEEEAYPAALKEGITQEEEAKLVNKIIEGLGMDGNKKFLPAIYYAMSMWDGEENAAAWAKTNLPPPIHMMFVSCWTDDWYVNELLVLEALHGSTAPEKAEPTCGCTLM